MAEKKTGKKFVQKPKFRNEKKYKTDKTEVKKYNTFREKKGREKNCCKIREITLSGTWKMWWMSASGYAI